MIKWAHFLQIEILIRSLDSKYGTDKVEQFSHAWIGEIAGFFLRVRMIVSSDPEECAHTRLRSILVHAIANSSFRLPCSQNNVAQLKIQTVLYDLM